MTTKTDAPEWEPFHFFLCGMIFTGGMQMAAHDFMGLEAWIEFERGHWTDLSPAWGCSAVLLAVVMFCVGSRAVQGRRS